MDSSLVLLLIAGLADGAALYAGLIIRRVHRRRIDARLRESAHLYGLVRVTLADRQTA